MICIRLSTWKDYVLKKMAIELRYMAIISLIQLVGQLVTL